MRLAKKWRGNYYVRPEDREKYFNGLEPNYNRC